MPEIIGDGVRRQFSCTSCDGRAWLDRPEVLSVCRQCNQPGELVEEGEEIEPRQFQCETCDGRVWYERAERSKCHDCENYGRLVPEGREIEYRQFVCDNAACEHLGHRWQTMAERSECRHCSEHGEMVPTGEEVGVFICKFNCECDECDCTNDYTVRCRMCNTAVCYRCRRRGHEHNVSPYGFRPLRFGIRRMTDNIHSCSDCNGSGNCPNFSRRITL